MAIKRTYIDDENAETAIAKLSAYLTATAVPKYFYKIESSDGVISCYADNDFIMMKIEYPLYTKGMTVYTRNNTSANSRTGYANYAQFSYAYECANGISFKVGSSGASSYPFALTIAKDDSENTVVIAESNLRPTSLTNVSVSVHIMNEDSDEINPLKVTRYDAVNFSKTVLAPLVVNGSNGNYTPDVFLQLFDNNNEQGMLNIGGIKYFSNGLWCVKDE